MEGDGLILFEGISIATLTPAALDGLFVLLVFFGALVPWRVYKEIVRDRDNWKKVAETEREVRVTGADQDKELFELVKTSHSILVAVFGNDAERARQSGEANVVPTPTIK